MIENTFDSGDYVRWLEKSKSGRDYYEYGMVTGFDSDMAELELFKSKDDYIRYFILTNEGEELTKFGKDLEPDIQAERNNKLNNLLDDGN